MRPSGAMGGGFSGGGPVTTKLTIVVGVVSVLVSVLARSPSAQPWLAHLLFSPERVLAGELWQVLTYSILYPIVGDGRRVFGFLMGLLFLWSIGGQMEAVLGGRRFLGFWVVVSALAAIGTIPAALLLGTTDASYDGLWPPLAALTILFAHHYANQRIFLSFVLPVRGRWLMVAAFGILGLYAIAVGVASILPEFFAMICALAYVYGLFAPRRAWLRFRAWRIERELKRRTSRLSVIRGGEADEGEPAPPGQKKNGDERGPWLH